jgi:hypothetical protein
MANKKTGLKAVISAVREHLEAGHTITGLDALKLFGTIRLAACISPLRKNHGLNIKTSTMQVLAAIGKETEHTSPIAVYWLKAGAWDGVYKEQYDPAQIVECAS